MSPIIKILVLGFSAFLVSDILGCLLDGGKIFIATSGGGQKFSPKAFMKRHTAFNVARAVLVGVLVGASCYGPAATQSPLLGMVCLIVSTIMAIAILAWFLGHARRWSELFWFALLELLVTFGAQASVGTMSLWWQARILTWIFFNFPWFLFAVVIGFAGVVLAMRFYRKTQGPGWKGVAIFIAILTVVAIILIAIFGSKIARLPVSTASKNAGVAGEVSHVASAEAPTTAKTAEQKESEVVKALTVKKVTKEQFDNEMVYRKYAEMPRELSLSSLSPTDAQRTKSTGFSDALTFGFESRDEKKMISELKKEIMTNPIYGVTVANAIRDKKIGKTRIGSFNSWLDDMVKKNDSGGVAYWCEAEGKNLYVTDEYRECAATICDLIDRLVPQGIQSKQTIENWCLNASIKDSERKGIEADYQYTKEALILAYVTKDEAGSKNPTGFIIGLNVHDKRPEFYGESTPEIKEPITPSSPSNPSNPDNPPGPTESPTTIPSPTESPTEPPTEGPTYNKDKTQSDNSGTNDDSGPGSSTNNGDGAQHSSKDNDTNSDHLTPSEYDEKMEELNNINAGQKDGNDDSTPSYNGGGTADNNGDAANNPSSQSGYEPELPGGGSGNKYWDGSST